MLIPGTRLGSFEIGPLLGVGGMGEVYRARDVRLGREVAIKVLPAVVGADPERAVRFQREARVLATLNHPNIAAIHGVEEHAGVWALVLELVEGETLADRLARGPVPPPEVARLAGQLIDALDAAHERGIVHRDLKPANIKVTDDGTLKVLDFGLAKAIAEPGEALDPTQSPTISGATRGGVILGTAAYMSPEQARGRGVDKRADIWAFGCVLFELLAARRPFDGESISDVIVGVLEREPPWSALPPGTPPSLRRLIGRCLEKDVKARLRDIADARTDLGTDGPVRAASATPASRRSAVVYAAFGALATLAAVSVWSRWTFEEAPSFQRVTRIIATSAHEYAPAISPDGKWIAYLSNARGPTDLWVKFIAGGEPANLTASLPNLIIQAQDYVGGLQISPDGNSIAFMAGPPSALSREFSSWVIPAPLGGTPRRVLEPGNQALTWSADGTRIAYMAARGAAGDTVWVADSDGQNAREIVRAYGGRHTHWLRWSPDGAFVYFNYGPQSFNSEPMEIFRVPVAGGPPEPVVRSTRRAIFPFPDAAGRGFFYAANPDTVDLALWWRDSSSGRDYRLINGIGEYGSPSVSADGARLVSTVSAARQHLARIDLGAGAAPAVVQATDALSGDLDPDWSPDGTHIVFSSLRGGDRNIWMAARDLTGAVPLTFGGAIDERPAFSPDGRDVAFVSDRGGQRGVWVVGRDGGAPRRLAVAEVLGERELVARWTPTAVLARHRRQAQPRDDRARLGTGPALPAARGGRDVAGVVTERRRHRVSRDGFEQRLTRPARRLEGDAPAVRGTRAHAPVQPPGVVAGRPSSRGRRAAGLAAGRTVDSRSIERGVAPAGAHPPAGEPRPRHVLGARRLGADGGPGHARGRHRAR
jgi:Tol biopolymer transport system component